MAQHAFTIRLPLWQTVGVTYINRKTADIHHGQTPITNCLVTRKLMLYARCTMTIYGNMTTHACLVLVTSQHWRHNIIVIKPHSFSKIRNNAKRCYLYMKLYNKQWQICMNSAVATQLLHTAKSLQGPPCWWFLKKDF